jgi:hypothetical protein
MMHRDGMKVTIDIPRGLYRQVKARSALEGVTDLSTNTSYLEGLGH